MNQSALIKTSLHYGALSGIAVFLFYFALYSSGNNIFAPVSMLGIWIPVVFIIISIRFHRDQNNGGIITYGQALSVGLLTTLFSASLFGLCFYLFGVLYAPELLDAYRSMAAAGLEDGRGVVSESFVEKAMESLEKATMSSLAFSESFNKVLWGGVISLVTAAILKRKAAEM
jgi:hypothetical protein